MAAAAYGVAGLSGLFFLLRCIGPAPGQIAIATSFVVVFLVTGAQSAWMLRPYLRAPSDADVPAFVDELRGADGAHRPIASVHD